MIDAIVTVPPYAPFIDEVVKHPVVSGLRLNTVMPTKEPLEILLRQLTDQAQGKNLWIDLKCRQLRVKTYGVPPFTEIELTHTLTVDTPVTAYFSDGKEHATVIAVKGNQLIMQDGPRRVVGPGEAVNIPHPSLTIDGYLTSGDKKYIEAALKAGNHQYMLSFVEQENDASELLKLDPQAIIMEKIESLRGLEYATGKWKGKTRLMAARGDMFVEMPRPHKIIGAMKTIIGKDATAIAASRIFPTLAQSYEPSCQDIGDIDSLMRIGYTTFMLGDDVCMRRDSVISALNLLYAMGDCYQKEAA